ncbi:hypothetical protein CQA53_05580 [Helicobacter didelphidarum]|uniref:Conjugal transfer protein TrbL n=1 Tax=Helicobacter didelphidarum TaxID=2040648 RepID=A0A3D8ILE8_9HELI|nr:type IV secretion system protein [Helicobacter didelphidarum]RDU65765.1 hypothetical protein CQA53_05580 [Helicobacter didelphidarum]
MAQEIGLYQQVSAKIGDVAGTMQKGLYDIASGFFTSWLGMSILTITLCIFIYTKIGKEWNREDFYKMGVWLTTYSIIYAIFSSYSAYTDALNMLVTPLEWVYGVIGSSGASMNIASGTSFVLDKTNLLLESMLGKFEYNQASTYFYALMGLLLWLVLLLFVIFLILFTIIIKFAALLILSFCPIMLPCLVIQPLRGYFWSWFKLYVSTAMQAPMAGLIGGAIMLGLKASVNVDIGDKSTTMSEITVICLTPIIITILGIALLSKIPAWAQAIVGSGDGEHKTGIVGAISSVSSMTTQGFSSYQQARNGMNYNTGGKNSMLRSMGAGLAGAIPGGAGLSQRIAGQTGYAKEAYKQNQMQSVQSADGRMIATPTPHIDNSGKNK